MLKPQTPKILSILTILACTATIVFFSFKDSISVGQDKKDQPAPKPKPQPQPFQPQVKYYTSTPDAIAALAPANSTDKMTDGLNALGAQGWGLIAIDAGGGDRPAFYVFQRIR